MSDLSQLIVKLVQSQPRFSEINEEQGQVLARCQLSQVPEDVTKKVLVEKQVTSNRDLQHYVEFVEGGTLLHLLAFVGCEDSTEWLLKQGAYPHSVNAKGNTPLHAAVVNNQLGTIRALRFYHADVYVENKEKKTSLKVGQEREDDEAKEVLLSSRFTSEEVETDFLQERLPHLVEQAISTKASPEDQRHCLMCLRGEIRVATSSMTSVPKPLKLLGERYDELKEAYTNMHLDNTMILADILSVLAMTQEDKEHNCLKFRLEGSQEAISSFGHPYIRKVCGEIPEEWGDKEEAEQRLLPLVLDIVNYCLQHNAETEACDLLMEIDSIGRIIDFVTVEAHERVCLYLTSCVKYVPEPEDTILLNTAIRIYRKFDQSPSALRLAMMLNNFDLIREIFLECPDRLVQKQLAFMLGRQQLFLSIDENDCPEAEDLTEIMANAHLNTNFLNLGRELDIMDPKVPEDIYKTHLEHARFSTAQAVDSARANLASSFVNGFLNCAFGVDKLLTEDNEWFYRNKTYGILSATASLGLILLWDVECGLTQIDKFLYSSDDYVKSGALLACGIVNCGVRNECDPALALLSDYVQHSSNTMRLGAVIGLGLAYAGSGREDVVEVLNPVLWDDTSSFEVICLTALSCAMVEVGNCNGEVTENILHLMMNPDHASDLATTHSRFLALALGLLYLGKQDKCDATVAALKAIPQPFSSFATVLLEMCAYTGTGNVLKIQSLLHLCSEYFGEEEGEGEKETASESSGSKGKGKADEKDKGGKKADKPEPGSLLEPGAHQSLAVLGIALIAMGEEIGAEMALRSINHLLRYGEPVIRRAVPLALALISTSNPKLSILDTLSKFSHDADSTVARNAVFAMGLVGSGTNNARLAGLLRNLAQFYHKEPQDLFMVRLAQGLTHLGKGTLTLNPFHSDRALMTPVAVAGLLTAAVAMLDSTNIILGNSHYVLYYLTPAIQPRMLVTFDETLAPISVSVRVGQAVDVVGQAGKPKTITGFQTHTTPVLLAHGERAELATSEYIALTPVVEGFVILTRNPYHVEE